MAIVGACSVIEGYGVSLFAYHYFRISVGITPTPCDTLGFSLLVSHFRKHGFSFQLKVYSTTKATGASNRVDRLPYPSLASDSLSVVTQQARHLVVNMRQTVMDASMMERATQALIVMATSDKSLHARLAEAWSPHLVPILPSALDSELDLKERFEDFKVWIEQWKLGVAPSTSQEEAEKRLKELVRICVDLAEHAARRV
jgi:hypothetical protein